MRDEQDIAMPSGATLIHVASQHVQFNSPGMGAGSYHLPMVWALVDTEAPGAIRRLMIRGTGHPIPPSLPYVGSALCDQFVWHIFDGGEL